MPLGYDPGAASRPLVYLHQAQVRRQGRTALRDITFTLSQGENWLVVGPNGSGKSSFLSLLRGGIWPVNINNHPSRQFYVNGRWQISPLGWRDRTAHVSPELEQYVRTLPRIQSCAEIIGSGAYNSFCLPGRNNVRKDPAVKRLARDFGLTAVLDQPFAILSQGEAQKALLARAFMARPQVLFLDEPLTGLDQTTRQDMLAFLHSFKSKGIQIIAATHRPEDLTFSMHRAV
ncbi:MAG: ATP-binding cassette domain-containing protein, partial [Desulfovermiculus sp.]|nr:ATP-binding cassette domain-containing protein [Desulfovermiculus sp.]